MKKLAFGCFVVASALSLTAAADQMTGYISDSHCGAAHSSPSEANSKCVEKCLGKGSDPVLVSDGKVMKFDTDSKDKAKAFAGKNVTVDGSMEDGMVKINSISAAQ